jgi:hypothetical protein
MISRSLSLNLYQLAFKTRYHAFPPLPIPFLRTQGSKTTIIINFYLELSNLVGFYN